MTSWVAPRATRDPGAGHAHSRQPLTPPLAPQDLHATCSSYPGGDGDGDGRDGVSEGGRTGRDQWEGKDVSDQRGQLIRRYYHTSPDMQSHDQRPLPHQPRHVCFRGKGDGYHSINIDSSNGQHVREVVRGNINGRDNNMQFDSASDTERAYSLGNQRKLDVWNWDMLRGGCQGDQGSGSDWGTREEQGEEIAVDGMRERVMVTGMLRMMLALTTPPFPTPNRRRPRRRRHPHRRPLPARTLDAHLQRRWRAGGNVIMRGGGDGRDWEDDECDPSPSHTLILQHTYQDGRRRRRRQSKRYDLLDTHYRVYLGAS